MLIVVSAGNRTADIDLDVPRHDLRSLADEDLERVVLSAVATSAHLRRLLSPAEAVNVLSVGAAHADASESLHLGRRINPLTKDSLPSPVSPLGYGFRRSVKPDVLMAGGRQTYGERLGDPGPNATLRVDVSALPPGQRVATPGLRPGDLSETRYERGTSNAAALTSRLAAQALEVINQLTEAPIPGRCWAPLLKATVVHSAGWGSALDAIGGALGLDRQAAKFLTARFAGYGAMDPSRALFADDHRATLLGWGEIPKDEGHLFTLPLPDSLAGQRVWRRLTLTLAWLSPISVSHHKYRSAALWIAAPEGTLRVSRLGADWHLTRRGTVQHEVFEGEQASAFEEGANMEIRVSCAEEAPPLSEPVPYGLAVTLEVAPEMELPIYEEIAARIRPAVRVDAPTAAAE